MFEKVMIPMDLGLFSTIHCVSKKYLRHFRL